DGAAAVGDGRTERLERDHLDVGTDDQMEAIALRDGDELPAVGAEPGADEVGERAELGGGAGGPAAETGKPHRGRAGSGEFEHGKTSLLSLLDPGELPRVQREPSAPGPKEQGR